MCNKQIGQWATPSCVSGIGGTRGRPIPNADAVVEKEAKVASDTASSMGSGSVLDQAEDDWMVEGKKDVDVTVDLVTPWSVVEKRLSVMPSSAGILPLVGWDRLSRRAAARIVLASARRSTKYFGSPLKRSLILRE